MCRLVLIVKNLFIRLVIPLSPLACLLWQQRKSIPLFSCPEIFGTSESTSFHNNTSPRPLSPTHPDPRPVLRLDLHALCCSNGNFEWLMALTPPGWAFEFMISTHDAPVFVLE